MIEVVADASTLWGRLLRSVLLMTRGPTEMIHYACDACDVTATCVLTPSAEVAWGDHMDSHDPLATSQRWVWEVMPLDFTSPDTLWKSV